MSAGTCKWCDAELTEESTRKKYCVECGSKFDIDPVVLMGHKWHPGFLRCHKGLTAALESGEIEGMKFRVLDGEIEPGDTYIAERNVGLQLLTCKEVISTGSYASWVQSVETGKYPYDLGECIRIELVLD